MIARGPLQHIIIVYATQH